MFNTLLVESDRKLHSLYAAFITKQGYNVISAYDISDALGKFEANHIDILICNLMLPSVDGIMLIESIRHSDPDLPILVLSAFGDLRSKQRAFGIGCDDFMVEPVDLNELALRMASLLRRAHSVSKRKIVVGDAVLDSDTLTVVEGTRSTSLPLKEFLILFKLCSSPDRIFTRREIMDDIWGIQTESNERTVDVHVKRLRKRFESSASFRIDTVRGVGYKATILK